MIFKHKQRDKRKFSDWLWGLLGCQCCSHIRRIRQQYSDYCELKSGHAGKHRALIGTDKAYSWGYGDDYFGHAAVRPLFQSRQECACQDCMEPGLR